MVIVSDGPLAGLLRARWAVLVVFVVVRPHPGKLPATNQLGQARTLPSLNYGSRSVR
jgi:hypothetical protein